jgi:hypothetical protein
MKSSLGLKLSLEIFAHLELRDIMACALVSQTFYNTVAKYLISRLFVLKEITSEFLEPLSSRIIFKLFRHFHYKKLVVFRSLEFFEDTENPSVQNIKVPLYPGLVIESIEFSTNYVLMKTMTDGVYHLTYFRNFYDRFNSQFGLPDFKRVYLQLKDIKAYSLKAKNFIYQDVNNRLQIRFYSNQEHVKDELQLPFEPCLQKFSDSCSEISSFAVCEQYMVFSTIARSWYLVEGFNSILPENILTGKINTFKIEVDAGIKTVAISNSNVFFLTDDSSVLILPLNKNELTDRLTRYNTNKNSETLVLKASPCHFLRAKNIKNVNCNKNLFIFEEEKTFKRFEHFSTSEVCSFLHDIDIKGLDKMIQYNGIDGQKLSIFDEKEMERVFGMDKRGGKYKLLDEISMRKTKRLPEPVLYIFGSNSSNQFGMSPDLNYIVEIDIPKFDPNEFITELSIGFFNSIFLTNNGRAFIASKNIEADPRRRRLSSNIVDEVELPPKKKNSKTDKKDAKSDKRDKKDKNIKMEKKKNKDKPKQIDKKKYDWMNLKDYLGKHNVHLRDDEVVTNVQSQSKYFYLLVSDVYEETNKFIFYFKNARDFLNFIRQKKNFEPGELLFFHETDRTYHPYKTMLALEHKLSDVKLVKRKRDNFILWSKTSPYFDIRSIVN